VNVFATSPDPTQSARVLADQHVVKMPIEAAQVLGTVLRQAGAVDTALAGVTHARHPCTLWAGSSREAARWLLLHGLALCEEYSRRFGRPHGVLPRLQAAELYLELLPDAPIPPFPQVMDEAHQGDDAHVAYRACLQAKYSAWAEGGRPARYTDAEAPAWLADVPTRTLPARSTPAPR